MSDKTQMVTIEAPVGALIITKEQIEVTFRFMFDRGMLCEARHHTNDDMDDKYFQETLALILERYRSAPIG